MTAAGRWPLLRHGAGLAWTMTQALADGAAGRRRSGPEERAKWLHRWCGAALRRLAIDIEVSGPVPVSGLLVANHLGYLDVLVLSALAPCVFVAKREVASWPVFGRFARIAGTVFVDRERRSDAKRAAGSMQAALERGMLVVLFPEGTSSDGSAVLRFRSPLFEPAIRAGAPITAAHLSYSAARGDPGTGICYWGDMVLATHLPGVLAQPWIRARVRFGAGASRCFDRKDAARRTHREVAALAASAGAPLVAV